MSDCLRAMDAPWQSTINKSNHGYAHWFRIYLQYVDRVYHFSWSGLGCQECGNMIDKYDYKEVSTK
jgi:hypothetical protein